MKSILVTLLRMAFLSPKDAALMGKAAELLQEQGDMLREAARSIDEWQRIALTSQRSTRDLAVAWRVSQETPEIDLREDLDTIVQELSDAVAQLEEHIPH